MYMHMCIFLFNLLRSLFIVPVNNVQDEVILATFFLIYQLHLLYYSFNIQVANTTKNKFQEYNKK